MLNFCRPSVKILPWRRGSTCWETNLLGSQLVGKPTCWETNLLGNQLVGKPTCWETNLLGNQLVGKPTCWETNLLGNQLVGKPTCWETNLLGNQLVGKPTCWETNLLGNHWAQFQGHYCKCFLGTWNFCETFVRKNSPATFFVWLQRSNVRKRGW